MQVRFYGADSSTEDEFHTKFPSLRNLDESKQIPQDDYVAMIADGLKLNKVTTVTSLFEHKIDVDLPETETIQHKELEHIEPFVRR